MSPAPRRRPPVSPHAMWSARQRLVVLTFPTVADAEAWDADPSRLASHVAMLAVDQLDASAPAGPEQLELPPHEQHRVRIGG